MSVEIPAVSEYLIVRLVDFKIRMFAITMGLAMLVLSGFLGYEYLQTRTELTRINEQNANIERLRRERATQLEAVRTERANALAAQQRVQCRYTREYVGILRDWQNELHQADEPVNNAPVAVRPPALKRTFELRNKSYNKLLARLDNLGRESCKLVVVKPKLGVKPKPK